VDQHIYEGQRHHYGQPAEHGVKVYQHWGGAALVADLLTELLRDPDDPTRVPGRFLRTGLRLLPAVPAKGIERAPVLVGRRRDGLWRRCRRFHPGENDRCRCDRIPPGAPVPLCLLSLSLGGPLVLAKRGKQDRGGSLFDADGGGVTDAGVSPPVGGEREANPG
jgi:hypothetical protein